MNNELRVETIEDLTKVANTLRVGCGMIADLPLQVMHMAKMPQTEREQEVVEFGKWISDFLPGLLAAADLCEQLAAGRSTRN